jgi:beta-lactamase regulating signal transducer with metallopeptidase domain
MTILANVFSNDLSAAWLSQRELIAVGWTLLHFCWQGAAIAMVYALADRLTRHAASTTRYVIALAAFLLMPLAVAATFSYEMRACAPISAMSPTQPSALLLGTPDLAIPPSHLAQLSVANADRSFALLPIAERVLPWLDLMWMLGVLVLALRATAGWLQLERLRRRARGIASPELARNFERVRTRLGVGSRVALRISAEVISPLAMGVWRTTVILPVSSIMRLSSEELEAVLAHELGHIRRWDYLCNLFQIAVESLLFFHPAVRWVSKAVRDRREICCDEIAVTHCVDAVVYAQALLRLEEQKTLRFRPAMALKGHRGSLLGRVEKVLGEKNVMENRMTNSVRVMTAAVVLAGLFLGPRVTSAVAGVQVTPVASPSEPSPATPVPAVIAPTPTVPEPAPTPGADSEPQTRSETRQIVNVQIDSQMDAQVSANANVIIAQTSNGDASGNSSDEKRGPKGPSYIDSMRAAGYPLDLNKDFEALVSLKSLGVTPEYARQMANVALGKPSLQELTSLKALGVTPEYVSALRNSGIGPSSFQEAVSEKALGITAEYSAAMKKSGFGDLKREDLISLKAQNVSPEYVTWLKQRFPSASIDDLRQASVFHLDEKFLSDAKSHGFDGKDLSKLLRLKISGLLDE